MNFFKKSICVLAALMLLFVLASCSGNTDTTPESTVDQVSQNEVESNDPVVTDDPSDIPVSPKDTYAAVENEFIVCSSDGTKILVLNKSTNRELTFELPKINANLDVSDIWQADEKKATEVKFSAYHVFAEDGNLCISAEQDGITVKTIVQLNGSEAHFFAEITNNSSGVVTTSEFPKMDLTSLNHFNAMWPYKDGEKYTTLNYINVKASYPSQLSMQLVTFFTEEESIYYYCADESFSFKWFHFNTQNLWVKQYPFVAPGETKTTADIIIGFESGDWYNASDIYRTWLLDAIGGEREMNPVSADILGMNCIFVSTYPRQIMTPYFRIPGTERMLRETTGGNVTLLFGWHEDGFDSLYPEHNFYDRLGGETAFASAISLIHNNGGYVIPYVGCHTAETQSDWYQEYGESNALRYADWSMSVEDYGTGLTYIGMCPCADDYQEAFWAAAERLRKAGADGLWIDQLMEMPSQLCYNKDHGHDTPATAYYTGYSELMQKTDEIMAKYGDGWFYSCEGVCDAYAAYIDLATPVWWNKYGYVAWDCPEFTRYTLPINIQGISHDSVNEGTNSFGRAFLMSNPLLSGDGQPEDSKAVIEIYETNPTLYIDGEYLGAWETISLDGGRSTLYSSIISTERQTGNTVLDRIAGDTIAVQFFYDSQNIKSALPYTYTFDLEREIASAIDAATGEECEISGTTVKVSIDPGDVKSIICTFK